MKQVIFILILLVSFSSWPKPDECHHPKPKTKRTTYKKFQFNKKNWIENNFLLPEHKLLTVRNNELQITHEIPIISALMFKNTKWTEKEVTQRIDNAALVLNQCGVRINKTHLVKTIAPNKTAIIRRHRACFDPEPEGQHHITNTIPYLPGIRIFFIERFIIGPEAFAASDYNSKNTPAENTIWIRPSQPRRIEPKDPNFQVLAHELGHILLNSGHIWDDEIGTPNLMSGKPSLLNNILTEKQCQLIKNSRLVQQISP